MKKLLLIIITAVFITGCEKSKNEVGNTDKSFTVKYELITSQEVAPPQNPFPLIQYTNGTGQPEVATNFSSGKTWTKTVTVTDTRRPFIILFNPEGIFLKSAGTITGNIYINGAKKATVTNSSTNFGGHQAVISMSYSVQ